MEELSRSLCHSHNINKFDIVLSDPLFDCRIFWARVVGSETESLFTQYTKHSFYEIQYALRGRIGLLAGEDTPIYIEESQFILVPPDTYHQIVESEEIGSRFIMAFSFQPKNHALRRINDPAFCLLPRDDSPHMKSLLSVILQKNYHDDPLRRESITALVHCFFLEVLEQLCPRALRRPEPCPDHSPQETLVTEIERFLHEYNGIGLSASSVAAAFSFSERHLSRLFQSVRNYSLRDAINREKLKKIEELVLTTQLSLTEISALCGFSDEYAMNKFFRRLNKINLSEFRRLQRKTDP